MSNIVSPVIGSWEERAPSPSFDSPEEDRSFHRFNDLPTELREQVWTEVVLQKTLQSSIYQNFDFRCVSQAVASETEAMLFKHAVYHINPSKCDGADRYSYIDHTILTRVQNIDVELTYERSHKWRHYDEVTHLTIIEALEDHDGDLEAFWTQGLSRRTCRLSALTNDDAFQVLPHIARNLQHLRDFETLTFDGWWEPCVHHRDQGRAPPLQPFEDFKLMLERGLGPVTVLDVDPLHPRLEFHPRRFRDDGFEGSDCEDDVDDDDGEGGDDSADFDDGDNAAHSDDGQ